VLKGRAEINPHFFKASAALLLACNACSKAAAAFEKCAFISARSLNKKMIERSQKIKLPFQQKSRHPRQASFQAYKKPQRLLKNAALFQHGPPT
jgi:hypothetical protein